MKRRNFLQGIAASIGATTLPVPVFAKAAAIPTKVAPFHYGWACVYARMNNGVAAADIARVFRLSGIEAHKLMERMVMRGVVAPPGLDGRSHPTKVWQPWDERQAAIAKAEAKKQSQTQQTKQSSAADLFRAVIGRVTQHPSYGWT